MLQSLASASGRHGRCRSRHCFQAIQPSQFFVNPCSCHLGLRSYPDPSLYCDQRWCCGSMVVEVGLRNLTSLILVVAILSAKNPIHRCSTLPTYNIWISVVKNIAQCCIINISPNITVNSYLTHVPSTTWICGGWDNCRSLAQIRDSIQQHPLSLPICRVTFCQSTYGHHPFLIL